jgi:sigma-B regulation protein RsbU (phosphoserine phosphatase)
VLGLFGWLVDFNQKKNKLTTIKLEVTNHSLKREIVKGNAIENHLRDMIDMYQADLNSAKLIQEFALPEIPVMAEVRMAYKYRPLHSIGGDLLSLIKLEGSGLGILIGDVVGHGISAALITSLVKVLSNEACRNFGTEPKKYLEHLNEEVNTYLPDDYYFTALYGVLRSENGISKLIFSRGGHPSPFIYSPKDKHTSIRELSGIPLGLMEKTEYAELQVQLSQGDRVYFITDGLLEVRNNEGTLLGIQGFCNIVDKANNKDMPINATLDYIVEAVKSYATEKAFADDCLILGIEIL